MQKWCSVRFKQWAMLLMNFKSYLPLIVLCIPLFSLPGGLRQEADCPDCCSNFRMGCLSRTLHGILTRIWACPNLQLIRLSHCHLSTWWGWAWLSSILARLGQAWLRNFRETYLFFIFFKKIFLPFYNLVLTLQISFPILQFVAQMKAYFKN
jgi:hypothetical protein